MADYVIKTLGKWHSTMHNSLRSAGIDVTPIKTIGFVVLDTSWAEVDNALKGFGGYKILRLDDFTIYEGGQ